MPNKQVKIHVIAHTHWDREWYFTKQDSDVLATYNFTHIIETLERNSEYSCYHLDGQTSIVEDYLAILPNMKSRLAKLVAEKRIFIGPWYTQTDTYNVSGESIIRNIKYGTHLAKELGHSMKIGYLPDTFGHNAQMPTLFRHCGIDNIIFWRGLDYEQHVPNSHFIWQAPSGQSIYAYHLIYGYGAAKNIKADDLQLENKIFPMVDNIKSKVLFDEVLLPSGGDQVNLDPHLPEILKIASEKSPTKDHYFISSMENYIEVLKENMTGKSFANSIYQGEFKTPRYTRIHKTIGSVRYDIKKLNEEIEQFILVKLEPMIAFAKQQGITVYTEVLDRAWKLILESHAHDSMGGCNSDATNQDVIHRLKQAKQLVDALYNLVVKSIAAAYDDKQLLIFNTQLTPFSGVVRATLFSESVLIEIHKAGIDSEKVQFEYLNSESLDGGKVIEVTKAGEKEVAVADYFKHDVVLQVQNIPALGYLAYTVSNKECSVSESDDKTAVTTVNQTDTSQRISSLTEKTESSRANKNDSTSVKKIENEALCLSFKDNNLFLLSKHNQHVIPLKLSLEDQADDGDSYDFSPLTNDIPLLVDKWEFCGIKTSVSHTESPIESMHQTLTIKTTLSLPRDLKDRIALIQSQALSSSLINSEVEIQFTLAKDNPQLLVKINHTNRVGDHRLRLIINSGVNTSTVYNSMPFALMQRDYQNLPINWEDSFREYPINIETTDSFVALQDETDKQQNFQLILRGLKEFQLLPIQDPSIDKAKIAITLFKSVGVLGKDNLNWRPGRASGINNTVVLTPDAQLLTEMQFEFALSLPTHFSHEALRIEEQRYLRSPFIYQKQKLNTFEHRLERFQLNFSHFQATHRNNDSSKCVQAFSLFQLANNAIVPPLFISSIGHSFCDSKAVLLRVFNAGTEKVLVDLSQFHDLSVTRVNYCEAPEIQDFSILPNDAIVLKITLSA